MAMRRTVSIIEFDTLAESASKLEIKLRSARKQSRTAKLKIAELTARVEGADKQVKALESRIHDQSAQVTEILRIVDQLKRENERLRLSRSGNARIGGNLQNLESKVWDGMWARTVSGGAAGTISR